MPKFDAGDLGRQVALFKDDARPSYPIKKALAKIEENYEQGLFTRNPAGAIFALKNFGWRDTKEIKHSEVQQRFP